MTVEFFFLPFFRFSRREKSDRTTSARNESKDSHRRRVLSFSCVRNGASSLPRRRPRLRQTMAGDKKPLFPIFHQAAKRAKAKEDEEKEKTFQTQPTPVDDDCSTKKRKSSAGGVNTSTPASAPRTQVRLDDSVALSSGREASVTRRE